MEKNRRQGKLHPQIIKKDLLYSKDLGQREAAGHYQSRFDPIQIKINIQNPSQDPPASSKAPNQDLKDMDVLCTFKIKIKSKNSDHEYIKDQ